MSLIKLITIYGHRCKGNTGVHRPSKAFIPHRQFCTRSTSLAYMVSVRYLVWKFEKCVNKLLEKCVPARFQRDMSLVNIYIIVNPTIDSCMQNLYVSGSVVFQYMRHNGVNDVSTMEDNEQVISGQPLQWSVTGIEISTSITGCFAYR